MMKPENSGDQAEIQTGVEQVSQADNAELSQQQLDKAAGGMSWSEICEEAKRFVGYPTQN